MIFFVSRMTVKPGREEEFITHAKALMEKTKTYEPETLYFHFFRGEEERQFIVVESFPDEEAEQKHMNTPHFKEIAPALVDCLEGHYVREYLHPLEG